MPGTKSCLEKSYIETEQERVDRELARMGDLGAIERSLQRERIKLERERIKQLKQSMPAAITAADVGQASVPAAPTAKARSKGVSATTLHATRAFGAYLYSERKIPRTAKGLAKAVAEKAAKSGLPGADTLNHEGSSMRDLAKAFLEGIEWAELE
jgi:hypothetical protein